MIIQKDLQSDFPKAQVFYSSVKYYSKIQSEDIVFSARDDNEIVGVVRLALENECLVLRGMMIAKSHQRKKIGSLMLGELEKSIGAQDCFCIPHGWLEGFYGQIGFEKVEESLAPLHLQKRINANREDYPHLIMMKRYSVNRSNLNAKNIKKK